MVDGLIKLIDAFRRSEVGFHGFDIEITPSKIGSYLMNFRFIGGDQKIETILPTAT